MATREALLLDGVMRVSAWERGETQLVSGLPPWLGFGEAIASETASNTRCCEVAVEMDVVKKSYPRSWASGYGIS